MGAQARARSIRSALARESAQNGLRCADRRMASRTAARLGRIPHRGGPASACGPISARESSLPLVTSSGRRKLAISPLVRADAPRMEGMLASLTRAFCRQVNSQSPRLGEFAGLFSKLLLQTGSTNAVIDEIVLCHFLGSVNVPQIDDHGLLHRCLQPVQIECTELLPFR